MARPPQTMILHERRGLWARQLRPRFPGGEIRWVETRSPADLRSALRGASRPVVLVDLGANLRHDLEDLAEARAASHDALILALEPRGRPEAVALARELGATLVLPGVVVPPALARLLDRWFHLARRRSAADGWAPDREPRPDPLDELIASVSTRSANINRPPAAPAPPQPRTQPPKPRPKLP